VNLTSEEREAVAAFKQLWNVGRNKSIDEFPPRVSRKFEYEVLECTSCKSIASRTTVPLSIADDYRRLNIPYKCSVCVGQQQTHMERQVGYTRAVKEPTLYDKFGRFKDRERDDD
jgi:hypothetical protein